MNVFDENDNVLGYLYGQTDQTGIFAANYTSVSIHTHSLDSVIEGFRI